MNKIQKQTEYFIQNEKLIISVNTGKVIIIGADMKVSAFDTPQLAYAEAVKTYGYGNFMLKDLRNLDPNTINIVTPTITTTL